MSRWIVLFALVFLFSAAAHLAQSGAAITSINPAQVVAGNPATEITITGSGFSAGSSVRIAGESVPFTFVDAGTLRTTIPPARMAAPATISITVDSASAVLLVYSPDPPSIAAVSAVSGLQGALGGTYSVSFTGNNLIGASVTFSGTSVSALVNPTSRNTVLSLTIAVAPDAVLGPRTFTIVTPSGSTGDCGSSAACSFNVVDGGRWVRTGSMNQARSRHSAVLLLDGRVLIAGGIDASSTPVYLKTAQIYDPATNSWSFVAPMSLARASHVSVLLPDGRVLVAGGIDDKSSLTSAEIFDPVTGRWSPTGFLTAPLAGGTTNIGIVMPDGRILFRNQIYDPATGNFTPSTNPGVAGAVLPDGRVIVMANSTYMYTPATDISSQITLLASSGTDYFVQLLPDRRVFGRTLTTGYRPGDYSRTADAGLYDYMRDVRVSSATTGSTIVSSPVLLSDGRILFAGSHTATSSLGHTATRSSYIYDPATEVIQPAGDLNDARDLPVVTRLNDGRVLATGGPLASADAKSVGEVFTPPASVNPVPVIDIVSARPGSSDQDATTVEITGSNFITTTAASLGGQRLLTIYLGSERLIALVPAKLRATLQTASVVLTNPGPGGGSSNTGGSDAGPFISGINPNSGSAGSSIDAAVSGSNLGGAISVVVGGTGVTASILSGASPTSLPIRLTIAAGAAAGSRSVAVTTAAGTLTVQNLFTVLPDNVTPTSTAPLPISQVEQGGIRTGYVVLTPATDSAAPTASVVFGMVSNAQVLSQGSILPTPLTTDAAASLDILPSASRNLGLAIANPGDTAITLNVTLQNEAGVIVATTSLPLAARSQIARFVTELFSPSDLGSAFRGSIRVQSSTAFSILGLRFVGLQFAATPVPGAVSITTVPARLLSSGTVGGTKALVFPQFALSGGWATQISLVNNSGANVSGRVDIFDLSGNPMPVTLNGQTNSMFSYSLAPGASLVLAPRDANGQTPF